MSDESALAPLRKTSESLQQIKQSLTPFLNLLDKYHNQEQDSKAKAKANANANAKTNEFDKQQIVEAESAVALAMGTLRYMAHRLKGEERGKKNNDPLRMELDRMRKTLVQVKALAKKTEEKESIGGKDISASKRKVAGGDSNTATAKGGGRKEKRRKK